MLNVKTLIPYLFGLVSLVVSLGIVNQVEPMAAQLPSPIPTATPLPKPEPFPGAARLVRCQEVSQPRFFFYIPTLTPDEPPHLTLSGTVYAPDLSPLPNALVEIWQKDNTQVNEPILFTVSTRTDETGYYEFNIKKPTPSKHIYFHYQVAHRDYCPLFIDLHVLLEPPSKPAKHIVPQVQVVGPVLQGPVNVVMPLPPKP